MSISGLWLGEGGWGLRGRKREVGAERGGDRRARGRKGDLVEAGGGAAGVHVTCLHQATTLGLSTVLPQVKELGVVMYNCSCLARDLTKIFEAYWFLGQAGSSIPSTWPRPYDTRYNQETPMEICLNGTPALAYLAVSPREEGPATCSHWTSSIWPCPVI